MLFNTKTVTALAFLVIAHILVLYAVIFQFYHTFFISIDFNHICITKNITEWSDFVVSWIAGAVGIGVGAIGVVLLVDNAQEEGQGNEYQVDA